MSTPLAVPGGQTMALNLSLITDDAASTVERQHGAALLALKNKIVHELERRAPAG
ncbi:hypothetical protein D3C73_1564310 [compost metagenome]